MIEVILSGGIMMWPLLAVVAGIVWIAARTAHRIRKEADEAQVRRGIHAVLFWGAMSVVLGILGTVMGLVLMAETVGLAGGADPALLWGGFGVSLVTFVAGLATFLVSAVLWFTLRQWHLRVRERRAPA